MCDPCKDRTNGAFRVPLFQSPGRAREPLNKSTRARRLVQRLPRSLTILLVNGCPIGANIVDHGIFRDFECDRRQGKP